MKKQEFINNVKAKFVGRKDLDMSQAVSEVCYYIQQEIRKFVPTYKQNFITYDTNRNSGRVYYVSVVNNVIYKDYFMTVNVKKKKLGDHYERYFGRITDWAISEIEINFDNNKEDDIEVIMNNMIIKDTKKKQDGKEQFDKMLELYNYIKDYCAKENLNVKESIKFLYDNNFNLEKESVK